MAWFTKFTSNLIDKYFVLPGAVGEVSTTLTRERDSGKYGKVSEWFFAPILGQTRGIDVRQLRAFNKSFWAKACIHTIIDEVVSLNWEVVPIDSEDETTFNQDDIERIEKFFKNPNRNHESLKYILRGFIRDILELDAGVIVKVFNSGNYETDEYIEVPGQIGDPKSPNTVKTSSASKTYSKKDFISKGLKFDKKKMVKKIHLKKSEDDKFRLTEIYARDGGCLKFGTMIETDKGFIPIGKIVNNKIKCLVKSYNKKDNKIEWKSVTNWFNNGITTEWIRLKAKTNRKLRSLIATPNHHIWTKDGYKKAEELNIGDTLYTQQEQLSKDQRQVLLGSLLGDGSLKKGSTEQAKYIFSETHSIKQKDYLLWKADILSPLNFRIGEFLSSYSKEHKPTKKISIGSKANIIFEEFYHLKYPYVKPEIVDELNELGLAIWIQDDGYYSNYGSYSISCGKIDMITLELIAKKLTKKFNINFKVREASRENVLETDKKNGEKLKELIKPYVHKSMSYKVNNEECGNNLDKLDKEIRITLCSTTIYKKERFEYYDAKYDIEVEDNHNFFAQGILVSNSFLKDVNRFGIEYGFYQYSFMQPSYAPIWFDKNEIIYASQYPRTESVYGWAPIQSIMEIVESLNESVRWNRDMFKAGVIPEGAIELPGADEDTTKKVKAEWEKEFGGAGRPTKPHRLLFYGTAGMEKGSGLKFIPFTRTAREMEFINSQKWNAQLVCMMFKTTPAELGMVPQNRACYSEDTEVLTENSWKKYNEVNKNEKIAVFDKDKNELKFEVPKKLMEYDVDEELFHIKNKRNDILVTKEHKILYQERRSDGWLVDEIQNLKYDRMKIKKAPSVWNGKEIKEFILPKINTPISKHSRYYRINEEQKLKMDDWLEFLGYSLSEGGLSSTSYLITFAQKDEVIASKIEACFRRLNLYYCSYKDKDDLFRWNVYGRQVWEWIKDNCGTYCYNKQLPHFIKTLSKRQINIFFTAVMDGDGHFDEKYGWRNIRLTSKKLIDDISDLAIKLGYSIGFYEYPPRTENHRTLYSLTLNEKKFAQIKKSDIHRQHYQGKVWCFETSTGFFVTRRNGKVAIQGNTQEGQERVHLRKAIKPMIDLIEYHFNNELMPEFFDTSQKELMGKTGGLKWQFKYIDPVDEAKQKDIEYKDLDHGVITINEIRRKRGLEEVEWGDEPYKKGGFGQPMQEKQPFEQMKDERKPDEFKPTKSQANLWKDASISTTTGGEGTPGSALVPVHVQEPVKPKKKPKKIEEESKSYADFLKNEFAKLEIKAIASVDELGDTVLEGWTQKEFDGEMLHKTFGEFISRLFNATFNLQFWDNVRKFIKKDFKQGINISEKEMKIDIGFEEVDEQAVNFLTDQQINGYTMTDGKIFIGIKGAKQELQTKIINSIHEGITKRESLDKLKDRVKERFDVNDNRAVMIARTETNRIMNRGKLTGYKKSGVDGTKKWISFIDSETTDICKALNNKTVPLYGAFEYKGKKFDSPPHGPNCRSTIIFLPKPI